MMEIRTHIVIKAEEYNFNPVAWPIVHSVQIERSRKMMEEMALVEVPNVRKRFGYIQELKPGATITVELGYNEDLIKEFTGVVYRFSERDDIIVMECEGAITYNMKRDKVTPNAWDEIKLADLVKYIVPDAEVAVQDVMLYDVRLEEQSPFRAIQQLSRKYGFDVFERTLSNKLFCVVPYTDSEALAAPRITYDFQRNAVRIGNTLQYRRAEEMRIKIKGISKYTEDGKTKTRTYEAGDDDGGVHTVHYYNKTEAELKALVDELLKEYKYDGVQGYFYGFWKPNPILCQSIQLKDVNKPVIESAYLIERIITKVDGSNGFKRMIHPGRKVAA